MEYVASTRRKWLALRSAWQESPALLREAMGPRAAFASSWRAYVWAAQTLDSRSIWWDGQRFLAPMLDLVNAANSDEVPHGASVHKTNAEAGVATTRAAWAFQTGEQVLEDYGQPNHVLFLYHGFSLAVNKHDCARLELDVTSDADAANNQRRQARLAQHKFRSTHLSACASTPRDRSFFSSLSFCSSRFSKWRKNKKREKTERACIFQSFFSQVRADDRNPQYALYAFVAIKHDLEIPSAPPPSARIRLALADEVSLRLARYEKTNDERPPASATAFLTAERTILRKFLDELVQRAADEKAFIQLRR